MWLYESQESITGHYKKVARPGPAQPGHGGRDKEKYAERRDESRRAPMRESGHARGGEISGSRGMSSRKPEDRGGYGPGADRM